MQPPDKALTPAPDSKQPDLPFALANLLVAQARILTRISDTLDLIAANTAPAAPNFRKPFDDFAHFDWTTIGAVVTATDDDGVSAVEWNGYDFTRRAGSGKFGRAIWFSRPTGKDAEGNNTYVRLVTFKDRSEAEPIPDQAQPKDKPAVVVDPQPKTQPVYSFEQAVKLAQESGVSRSDLVATMKAAGLSSWKPERDSANLKKFIADCIPF